MAMNQKKEILDKPIVLTKETFSQFVQKHRLVVIDCWAPWRGPCVIVSPTLLIFKDGDLVDSIIGALPKQFLEQSIKQYL